MRESIGKGVSREYFFAECLLDWLSPGQIKQGNFLLLLSETPRELAYIDALEVPRSQVFSVERNEEMYERQLAKQLGAQLHFGELTGYLATLLDGDQDFQVMNLDVEGSYLSQLDPAMTPVFLVCWRNPETVVATYSSVGRDTEMIWEGVKSLAIFLWLAPEVAMKTLWSLMCQYDVAGFSQPQYMALRDFFWIPARFLCLSEPWSRYPRACSARTRPESADVANQELGTNRALTGGSSASSRCSSWVRSSSEGSAGVPDTGSLASPR